jgi:hypothetical protein
MVFFSRGFVFLVREGRPPPAEIDFPGFVKFSTGLERRLTDKKTRNDNVGKSKIQ